MTQVVISYHNIYILRYECFFVVLRLHLHANFPYKMEIPNAALGYLKSALSEEKVAVTNIYWNLPPREIGEPMLAILSRFESPRIELVDPLSVVIAYLSRYFPPGEKRSAHLQRSMADFILSAHFSTEKMKEIAEIFKDFIDYSLENENMADVDVAGFTVNYYQWLMSRYIWSELKKLNPNIKIVVGGLATRGEAHGFMETFSDVDYAVYGEGEIPLKELVRRIDDPDSLSEVPHLVYRNKGRNELLSTTIPCGRNTFHFADHTDYFERKRKIELNLSPFIPIVSTRSCRWNKCKFCSLNKGTTYYERPIEDIIGEIEYQSTRYGVDNFMFQDTDIARRSVNDFEKLLTELLKSVDRRQKPYIMWAEVSPTVLNRKTVEMMSNIHISIQIGFEAVTDTLLKKMNKMHRFAENIQALKFGKDYNLNISGLNVIRNLPEVREEDVLESMGNLGYLRFVLHQYNLNLSELALFKGSPYYEEVSPDERERRWRENLLYSEIERMDLIPENQRWDFFGFRATTLEHSMLWDHFASVLEDFEAATISYKWIEFSDGSSLIEEFNEISGHIGYLLSDVETDILKFCDTIRLLSELRNEFSHIPEKDIEEAVSLLREEFLLYYEEEREYLLSIPSVENIRKIMRTD